MAVTKRSDGRYVASIRDVHGVRRHKIFDRQKDAKDFEIAIKKERQEYELIGVGARRLRYTIDDAIHDFVTSKSDKAARTIRRYNQILEQFRLFCSAVGVTYINHFTSDHATEFRNALIAERPDPRGVTGEPYKAKPKTVNMYLGTVKSLFRQEVAAGHIQRTPFLHIKQMDVKRKKPDHFTVEELVRFFAQPISRPYWLFFLGLLDTGMRYNEAASLRWEDVEFEERLLHVREYAGVELKTDGSERSIPISNRLYEQLVKLKIQPYSKELVFATETGRKIPERTALEKCKSAARKAGITRNATLHLFRSTFATMLVNQNVMIQQVSKLLGHASIEMTSDHYADIETKGLHDQVNVIGKIEIK